MDKEEGMIKNFFRKVWIYIQATAILIALLLFFNFDAKKVKEVTEHLKKEFGIE